MPRLRWAAVAVTPLSFTSLLLALPAPPALAQATTTRTPEAVAVQIGLERACLPLLTHRMSQPAGNTGVDHDDSGPFVPIHGQDQLRIIPPDRVNPTVCTMTLAYPAGGRQGMLTLLDAWSADHHLKAVKVDQPSQDPTDQRWTSTWTGQTPSGAMALAFSADHPQPAQSGPAAANQATIQISLTPQTS